MSITFENISLSYGRQQVLDRVSGSLHPAEIIHLKGDNGVGKTTLLKVLAGILVPQSGTISTNEISLSFLLDAEIAYESLTITEQLVLLNSLAEEKRDLSLYLENWHLLNFGKKQIANLSKGYRRRTQLACCFFPKSDLLLLDEPFDGLDSKAANILMQEIDKHHRRNGTVIYTSHQNEFALEPTATWHLNENGKLI